MPKIKVGQLYRRYDGFHCIVKAVINEDVTGRHIIVYQRVGNLSTEDNPSSFSVCPLSQFFVMVDSPTIEGAQLPRFCLLSK